MIYFYLSLCHSFKPEMKKILLFLILLSSCSRGLYISNINQPETIRPPYLNVGDTVGVVSVSSRVFPSVFDSVRFDLIRSWGLTIKFGDHLYDTTGGWFAGSDTARSADLQRMIDDKSVKAIIFNNGGFGAVRTLDYVNFGALRDTPKWLAGYSDVTMIHYAVQQAGIESIHGTMPVSMVKDSIVDTVSSASLRDALFGVTTSYKTPPHPFNKPGVATGRLTGGNLSLIYAANGTAVDNDLTQPSVLLIEDVSENIYNIDRMLQNLKRNGKLARAKAILVGHFTGTKGEDRYGKTVYELVHQYTSDLDVPVIFNFPVGHQSPNCAIYMGRKVRVKVDQEGGFLEFL